MALSNDIISQFAKLTKEEKKPSTGTIVNGTAKAYEGTFYVQLDGSDQLTPIISSTAGMKDGDRVTVLIKDHTTIVTGNVSSPSASQGDVDQVKDDVQNAVDQISEFEIIVADMASIEQLEVEKARIDDLVADNVTIKETLTANEADIKDLQAEDATITGNLDAAMADIEQLHADMLTAEAADLKYATIQNLEATNADIYNLEATYGQFEKLTTDKFTALDATILELDTTKLDAEEAKILYADIDFSNIGKAAIEEFFAKSGMISDLVVGDGTVTGHLVGVTISGDLIEGNTIKADKLVVLGDDGLYYKLNVNGESVAAEQTEYNSLNGSVITAHTITAEKVNVHDLVAFDATIGGFKITDDALYSGVKETVDNTTSGVYMDSGGQFAIGDQSNYLKYFYDETDSKWKLAISAEAIKMSSSDKTIIEEMALYQEADGGVVDIPENAGLPPRGITIYGYTRQNLWMNPPDATKNGIEVTANEDGTVGISGTSTGETTVTSIISYILKPGATYTVSVDKAISSGTQLYFAMRNYTDAGSTALVSFGSENYGLSKTFTVPDESDHVSFILYSGGAGAANEGAYKVMLNEGETAEPWCPPGLNSIENPVVKIGVSAEDPDPTLVTIDLHGNVLSSLKDGTRDELRIDASGTMTLIKRTSSFTYSDALKAEWSFVEGTESLDPHIISSNLLPQQLDAENTDRGWSSTWATDGTGDKAYRTWNAYTFMSPDKFTDLETAKNVVLNRGGDFIAGILETTTLIGSVDLPSLNKDGAVLQIDPQLPGYDIADIHISWYTEHGKALGDYATKNEVDAGDSNVLNNVYDVNESLSSTISDVQNQVTNAENAAIDLTESVTEITQKITNLEQTAEGWNFQWETTIEQITQLGDEIETNFGTQIKYIKFLDGEIWLGKDAEEGEDDFKLVISNDRIRFLQNDAEVAYINNNQLYITNARILSQLELGQFAFKPRTNGNLSFVYNG